MELLEGVEVEWKALGEVAKVSSGGTPRTGVEEYYGGDIPWLRTQEVDFGEIWDTGVKITEAGLKNSSAKWIPEDSVIVAMYGATVGKIGINKIPMATNQACANIHLDENIANYRYVFYYLSSQYEYIKSLGTGPQTNINAQIVKNLQIPIPPLAIQAEIVRILDAFSAHTAELTAELTARKKQYNYYRDQLLSFEEGEVEWKTLGEVGDLIRGNGLPKSDFTETGFPAIHYGQIYTYYGLSTISTKSFVSIESAKKLKKVDKGDVVITNTSENLDDVGKALVYLGEQQAVTGGHATIFKPSEVISGKFFAYFTQTEMFASQKRKYAKGTKVIDVSASDMAKINIPTPGLTEQARIVAILDKFDALTNSITEGLPREIELREQQYQYYRDLLLNFPKEEETALRIGQG